ncbi:MBL fold metallo-hydrolase [Nonomuraea angiospora]|uniref:MBL fold metallo-hydrolase n=1 Tax=Nonomuraea angiospora TaxID=46172 RepID=UPI003611A31B
MLFDTGSAFSAAKLHEDVRGWTRAPLTTAFYSHGHVDHVFGTGPFEESGPPPGRHLHRRADRAARRAHVRPRPRQGRDRRRDHRLHARAQTPATCSSG